MSANYVFASVDQNLTESALAFWRPSPHITSRMTFLRYQLAWAFRGLMQLTLINENTAARLAQYMAISSTTVGVVMRRLVLSIPVFSAYVVR